jgi:hypothetical protein
MSQHAVSDLGPRCHAIHTTVLGQSRYVHTVGLALITLPGRTTPLARTACVALARPQARDCP